MFGLRLRKKNTVLWLFCCLCIRLIWILVVESCVVREGFLPSWFQSKCKQILIFGLLLQRGHTNEMTNRVFAVSVRIHSVKAFSACSQMIVRIDPCYKFAYILHTLCVGLIAYSFYLFRPLVCHQNINIFTPAQIYQLFHMLIQGSLLGPLVIETKISYYSLIYCKDAASAQVVQVICHFEALRVQLVQYWRQFRVINKEDWYLKRVGLVFERSYMFARPRMAYLAQHEHKIKLVFLMQSIYFAEKKLQTTSRVS